MKSEDKIIQYPKPISCNVWIRIVTNFHQICWKLSSTKTICLSFFISQL